MQAAAADDSNTVYEFDENLQHGKCFICNVNLTSAVLKDKHLKGKRHRMELSRQPSQLGCNTCNLDPQGLKDEHLKSVNHRKKLQSLKQNQDPTEWILCDYCPGVKCGNAQELNNHQRGRGHQKRVEKAKNPDSSPSSSNHVVSRDSPKPREAGVEEPISTSQLVPTGHQRKGGHLIRAILMEEAKQQVSSPSSSNHVVSRDSPKPRVGVEEPSQLAGNNYPRRAAQSRKVKTGAKNPVSDPSSSNHVVSRDSPKPGEVGVEEPITIHPEANKHQRRAAADPRKVTVGAAKNPDSSPNSSNHVVSRDSPKPRQVGVEKPLSQLDSMMPKEVVEVRPFNSQAPAVAISELVIQFTCSECFDYALPPIMQCKNGHIVCPSCEPKLQSCPTCGCLGKMVRNLQLEKVAASVKFPCKYAPDGCQVKLALNEKGGKHEERCEFRPSAGNCEPTGSTTGTYADKDIGLVHHLNVEEFKSIDVGEKIGQGQFGTVYKGQKEFQEIRVAVKIFEEEEAFNKEKAFAWIKHPYIMPMLAICEEKRAIVYPYMAYGHLKLKDKHKPDQQARLRIIHQLLEAVHHLHKKAPSKQCVVHRDITPNNILIDENQNVRLADVGCGRTIEKDRTHVTQSRQVETGYADPKSLRRTYRPAHDLYPVGLIIMQLLTGKEVKDIEDVLDKLENKPREKQQKKLIQMIPGVKSFADKKLAKVAVQCLCVRHRKRVSSKALCAAVKEAMQPTEFECPKLLNEDRCLSCLLYPRVKKLSVCSEIGKASGCCFFCKRCLTNHNENPLFCPIHGPCVEPIGNERWFVLAFSGTDTDDTDLAGVFKRDVIRFCNTLKNSQICGIREENITQIVSAKSDDVLSALDKIVVKMESQPARTEDELILSEGPPSTTHITSQPAQEIRQRLFVFYSGHGSEEGQLGLNWDTNDVLNPQQINEKFKAINNADIVVFLDCCYAGNQNYSWKSWNHSSTACVFQVAACSPWQEALAGIRVDANSEFTEALLNCLTGVKIQKTCPKEATRCDNCKDIEKLTEEQGFIDLDLLKKYIRHALPDSMWPTFSGRDFLQCVPIAYVGENVEHIKVLFEDRSKEEDGVVEKMVYLQPELLDESSDLDVHQFIESVIQEYKNLYQPELSGDYGQAGHYNVFMGSERCADMQEIKRWYNYFYGIVRVKSTSQFGSKDLAYGSSDESESEP